MRRACALAPVAVAVLVSAAACGSSSTSPTILNSSGNGISVFLASAASVGPPVVNGSVHTGSAPAAGAGPAITVTGLGTAVASGGNLFKIHSATALQGVVLTVGNISPATSGYLEIDLSAAVTDMSVIVSFGPAPPDNTFDVQFQGISASGAFGPVSPVTTTLTTDFTTVPPVVVASYTPSPAPFLAGANCTLVNQLGCLWEFKVVLQEFNGVQIPSGTLNETFTFGSTTITNALVVSVPPKGVATVVRALYCGVAGTGCATAAQLKGGTYTFTLTGNDVNGNAVSFAGPILTLNPGS